MSEIDGRDFATYFERTAFEDRYAQDPTAAVDVIIPVMNTNELWRSNLLSFYREIPIARLIVGDGGSTDDTIDILDNFPRVTVIDQGDLKTLGGCLRQLIDAVETDWFVYLHSDVFLPRGWFDEMTEARSEYDWFECDRRLAVFAEFDSTAQNRAERPYSGSQMGKRGLLQTATRAVDDDYLYRNEDLIIRELVERQGGRYGRVHTTHHVHQVMERDSDAGSTIIGAQVVRREDDDAKARMFTLQYRGLIRYTEPTRTYLVRSVMASIEWLLAHDSLDRQQLVEWVSETNPAWLEVVGECVDQPKQTAAPSAWAELKSAARRLIGEVLGRGR